jgi:hypothetical protein
MHDLTRSESTREHKLSSLLISMIKGILRKENVIYYNPIQHLFNNVNMKL